MWRIEGAINDDVGAWGTNIAVRTFVDAVATEELHFNRGRKILVQPHAFWRLRMIHDSVVAKGPLRTTLYLLSCKPVLHGDEIVRELVLVEEMAKLSV